MKRLLAIMEPPTANTGFGTVSKAILPALAKEFEVNYQVNEPGHSVSHYHKEVTEITLVVTGRMLMNGQIFSPGEIIYLEPGDIAQLEYLEHTTTVTVKTPSIPSDKFLV